MSLKTYSSVQEHPTAMFSVTTTNEVSYSAHSSSTFCLYFWYAAHLSLLPSVVEVLFLSWGSRSLLKASPKDMQEIQKMMALSNNNC